MQNIIMSRRQWATWFMSTMKASFWEKQGQKKVLKRFKAVADQVPAYQKLLQEKNLNPDSIKTIDNFKELPIVDKKNYLKKFELTELCLDGKLSDKYLIDRSSGYSGTSFFWPRLPDEDKDYPTYMKLAYEQFYQIHEKSTLMIITLALGSWVGGEKISWATREIALRGENPFTVITPGTNIDETLEIVEYFKNKYDQIVIVGYPPFIKTIIDEGERRGIDWPSIKVKIGLGGEGYSEDWREYIREKIGMDKNDFMGIAGGYGAADLGMSVGREYPISVLIRKLAHQNKKLAKELFGEENIPSLCQYNPATFYIEEVDKELIFSCQPGIPLIRYNIHDRGGVIPFDQALEIAESHGFKPFEMLTELGYTKRDIWQLPFFYVYGRSDGTVSISGGKIYVENIKEALDDPRIAKTNTGNFKMYVEYDDRQNQKLTIKVELSNGIQSNDELVKKYQDIIVEQLLNVNSEYAILHRTNRKGVLPKVELLVYKQSELFNDRSIKNRYI